MNPRFGQRSAEFRRDADVLHDESIDPGSIRLSGKPIASSASFGKIAVLRVKYADTPRCA